MDIPKIGPQTFSPSLMKRGEWKNRELIMSTTIPIFSIVEGRMVMN